MENWNIRLEIGPGMEDSPIAQYLRQQFTRETGDRVLRLDAEGLCLVSEGQTLRGDFARLLPRLKGGRIGSELLYKAAKIKGSEGPLWAVDATAGLGEDSLVLAASGFHVTMFERNPVMYALLLDALERAKNIPELREIAGCMELRRGDSVEAMANFSGAPDVILLDPMFPERQKAALVKKKLQMIQSLEEPCSDEAAMLRAAMEAGPRKLIIKRPPKGPWLAGIKPDHSIEGKAVRFDCFVSPKDRLHKFFF